MRFGAATTTTTTTNATTSSATAGLHARSHVEAARMAVERRLRAAWQREDDAELLTTTNPPPPLPLRSALRSVSEASSSTAQPSQQQQPDLLSVRYLKEAVEQLTSFVFDELEATAAHLRTMQLSVHDTQQQLDALLAQTAAEKRRQAKAQAAASLPPPPPPPPPAPASRAAVAAAAAAAASNDDSAAAAAASSAVRGVVAALIEDAGAAAQRLSRAEASWAEQRAATHGTLEELNRAQRRAAAEAERLLARVGALEDGREEHAQALLTLRLRQWRPDGEEEDGDDGDGGSGGPKHCCASVADVADAAAAAAAEAAVEAARVGDVLERHAAAAEQRHAAVCGRLGSAEERAGRLEVDMACAKQAVNGLERQAGALQVAGSDAAAKLEAALAKVAELRSGTRRAFHSISECLNIPSPSVL